MWRAALSADGPDIADKMPEGDIVARRNKGVSPDPRMPGSGVGPPPPAGRDAEPGHIVPRPVSLTCRAVSIPTRPSAGRSRGCPGGWSDPAAVALPWSAHNAFPGTFGGVPIGGQCVAGEATARMSFRRSHRDGGAVLCRGVMCYGPIRRMPPPPPQAGSESRCRS